MCQIAIHNVTSARETRISKKGRRGFEYVPARLVAHIMFSHGVISKSIQVQYWCIVSCSFSTSFLHDSKAGGISLDLVKYFGHKTSVVR